MWRRRGKAASAAALYSAHHKLYSEAVVSSAFALAEVGRFGDAAQYLQKAAKALYEGAREVFERVKVSLQRLVELFVEAVTRMLAWVDEHKAYLFLMAAVAAGVVALSAALNLWGLVELEKLAYAASLTPFVVAGVEEYKEEALNILKNDPDPYERFKEIAKAANTGKVKLAEPWESLRKLILPKSSEERRLRMGRLYNIFAADERRKKALFYATLALVEVFGKYKSALEKYVNEFRAEKVEVGEEPFKQDMYIADLGRLRQLARVEEAAFEEALSVLKERLNEYAVKYGLRDLLNVVEGKARKLAEAEAQKLSEFKDVSFGVKAYAALIAYREYALGRESVFGKAARYWLEVGGSAWLLYYAPYTAYDEAEKARAERPATVEEIIAEALRRLFLKPGADHHSYFLEFLGSGKLALEFKEENTNEEEKTKKNESYVFRLFRLEEGGGFKELEGVRLSIKKVREHIIYTLDLDARWRELFKQELEVAMKAAERVRERLPVEDRFPYMLSWVNSDVAINEGRLVMSTSHLWQLAETHALFDWSDIEVRGMSLTLEGPKPQIQTRTSLEKLNEAIRISAEIGWLKILDIKAESWDDLKRWVVENWDGVVDAAVRRLGEGVRSELEALRDKLNDDKVAREVVAPALLLIQAERLGVNETTLRYFGAVISGAIGGDGSVSAVRKEVVLTSGEHEIALLWAAAFAAHGIKAKAEKTGGYTFQAVASGDDAARLANLYFLYGAPLLKGDERIINHKLAEAVELGAKGLAIRWEGLKRRTENGPVAADLIISAGGAVVKYSIYLRHNEIELRFNSTNRSHVELAARLLRFAGVDVEVKVKKRKGKRDEWYVTATTNMLAAGREELRKALAEIVETARSKGWVDEKKAERWLKKLESGITLIEGWSMYYVGLVHGALEVIHNSTDPNSIRREVQRLKEMGLEEGRHFTVKMPEDGGIGYVRVLKEGLAYIAWLSVYGNKEQRKLAEAFIELILQRAEDVDTEVRKKAKEILEKGEEWSSLTLERFEKKVEINGREYTVKVLGWSTELEESQHGKKLLRLKITAEVNGVRSDYTITFSRHKTNNKVEGFAYARADAPGGREADAERLAALIKALTGKEPRIRRKSDGVIVIACSRAHLDGFARYAEFAGAIEEWLKETSR